MGKIWELWVVSGNYGQYLGITGNIWEEADSMGSSWELWVVCMNYGQ